MNDLISRQAAIDNLISFLRLDGEYAWGIRECLNSLPSAQPDLDEWCTDCKEYDQEKHCCPRWNRVIRKTAEEVRQNAQPEQRWIPVEERLPEEPYGCLVTVLDTNPITMDDFENILPYFVGWDGEQWNDGGGEQCPFEVIAWMPLPTAYERSEDD